MNAIVSISGIENNQILPLVTTKGKTVGTRVIFGGTSRASDVKMALKKANPKMTAKELRIKVNEVVTGKNTIAWAEMQVAIEGMRSAGYTPDYADVRKSGGSVKFIKPTEPKASEKDAQIEALKAEVEAMKAMIAAAK